MTGDTSDLVIKLATAIRITLAPKLVNDWQQTTSFQCGKGLDLRRKERSDQAGRFLTLPVIHAVQHIRHRCSWVHLVGMRDKLLHPFIA